MDTLHADEIFNLDVSPDTIWLDEDQQVNIDLTEPALDKTIGDCLMGMVRVTVPMCWYASPEKIRGLACYAPSDIYYLGLTLYELLTGQKPFAHCTTGIQQMLHHVNEPLPSIQRERPDLPPAIDAVIQQATAKDPAARYASAGAFFQAYQQAIAR
jgi:serine/threonine protein kinase